MSHKNGKITKVINDIIERCEGVKIDIEDDGHVTIYHTNKEAINKAHEIIESITREAEVGEIYEGVVTRVEDYGCFVHLFGDTEGLCHVSQLANERVDSAKNFVRVGEKFKVKVIGVDDHGKVKLSHKDFIGDNKESKEEPKKKGFFRKK